MVAGFFARINDLDCRIQRFVRLPYFRRLIRGELVLVRPTSWEDRYEVRALVVFSDSSPGGNLLNLAVSPPLFIDEISFDPRLASGERITRCEMLVGTELEGRVVDSGQYQKKGLEIIVE